MRSVIVSAKTLEKAIEDGLQQLGAAFEDVDINVLSDGGFLKKFKVEIKISEDVEKEKQQKLAKLESKVAEIEKPETKTAPQPTAKAKVEKPKPEAVKVEKTETATQEEVEMTAQIKEIESQLKEFEQPQEQEVEKQNLLVQAQQEIDAFLNGLLNVYGIIAKVETVHEDRVFNTHILGDNLGVLIGYRGEALQAIQFILTNHVLNKTGRNFKIVLDIENYRAKRAETLEGMAENLAKKVAENKRALKLEPMSSYERKVIHTCLQGKPHISTHSEGMEPNRYLVIEYVD